MKVLYLQEHLSCLNYQVSAGTGFTHYELEEGETGRIDTTSGFCILFLLKGNLLVNTNVSRISVSENRMLVIQKQEENNIKALTTSECLLLYWNAQMDVCSKVCLSNLLDKKLIGDQAFVLPIRKSLNHVLRQVTFYLDAGLKCRHMHMMKQQEILLVMKSFYSRSELSSFFAGIVGMGKQFENFVMENYKKVKTVKEFASLCHLSERAFSRKFNVKFGQSPYQWMQERKAEQIRKRISDPDIPLQTIAVDFGFNSPAHFSVYCRKKFGMPPSKLRRIDIRNAEKK